jgi:hypothetical protein
VLFYYQQCTAREVGDALGLGEDAVMQRLSRGRRQLGEALAGRADETLARRRSRAGLAVVLLGLLPVRSAVAAPSSAGAWWVRHVRAISLGMAVAIGALVLVAASAKSEEVAAANREETAEHIAEPASPHAAPAPPRLPARDHDSLPYTSVATASYNAGASCARGVQQLAWSIFGDDPDDSARRLHADGRRYYEMSPIQQDIEDRAEARVAEACGDGSWPEVYVKCEGSRADLVDGTVNCYPYDPWSPT